jgi:putative selenium metabolism hydrolase
VADFFDTWSPPAPTDLAELALRLVGRQSLSGHEEECAASIARTMRSLGYVVDIDDLGNVIGTFSGGPGPCVLLDAHIDTVGTTDAAAWDHAPEGEIVAGRLYGRGSVDMKGPLAAALLGVAGLGTDLPWGKVVVAATVCEELVEGAALTPVLERIEPDFVVICEATDLGVARGQRGRMELLVEVQGKATHSSRPDLGVNAAEGMADVVRLLRRLQPPVHPVLGPGVLVLTDLLSEPYPGLSVTPHLCRATYDRRTLPGETEEGILAPIHEVLGEAGRLAGMVAMVSIAEDVFSTYTGAEVRAPNYAPAWLQSADSAIVTASRAGLRRAGLGDSLTTYAFATNGSASAGRLGIATVGFGPGREELAHRADEHVHLADLVAAARGYAAIVAELLGTANR